MDLLGHRDIRNTLHEVLGFSEKSLERSVRSIVQNNPKNPEQILKQLQDALGVSSAVAGDILDSLDKSVAVTAVEEGDSNKVRKVDNEEAEPPPPAAPPSPVESEPVKLTRDSAMKDDPIYLAKLRDEARREYLRGRETTQLELAERIAKEREIWYQTAPEYVDEEHIEAHKAEKQRIDFAKQIQEERSLAAGFEAYTMPEDYDENLIKRLALMKAKMVEPPQSQKQKPMTEREAWEKQQSAMALSKYGAQDRLAVKAKQTIITESGEAIEFVQDDLNAYKTATNPDDAWWNQSLEERESAKLAQVLARKDRLQSERESLPVYNFRADILKAIRDHSVLIIVGETGSGKTTQIPQFLDEVGYSKLGKIACTQPRRVAAMSVAARVAEERGVRLGRDVGYLIRFENCTTDLTRINYMTDGMLLQQFLAEPELTSYSCVMIDEAHERTLHTDILFGLVKDLARHRAKDFKLLISSATLEAEKFSQYFDDAPIFKVPGRKYEVEIYYTKSPEANYIDATVVTVMQIHKTQPLGDILVFLPGQQEIEEVTEEIHARLKGSSTRATKELKVLAIYAALPSDQQAKIFEPTPPNARKCVLATNIAETSITIDNVVYVIDPGLVKQNSYNPKTGMESLVTVPCSRASANQRAGRAGRVKPGKCFRLYTSISFQKEMSESNVPEIQRSNICQVVLTLKTLGVDDLLHFDFLDPPPTEALLKALELLYALGALNDLGQLTKVGRQMSQLPGNPQLAKMIIQASLYECVHECIVIASMLEVSSMVFYRPKEKQLHADNARKSFFRLGGDHLTLLNVYKQWEATSYDVSWCFENYVQHRALQRARDIYDQFASLVEKVEVELSTSPNDSDAIRKAITSGYFMQAAKLTRSGQYRTVKYPQTVDIHPHSSLFFSPESLVKDSATSSHIAVDEFTASKKRSLYRPDTVVYDELVLTTKEFMRNVIEINPKWLLEVAPHYFSDKQDLIKTAKMPKGASRKTDRLEL